LRESQDARRSFVAQRDLPVQIGGEHAGCDRREHVVEQRLGFQRVIERPFQVAEQSCVLQRQRRRAGQRHEQLLVVGDEDRLARPPAEYDPAQHAVAAAQRRPR